MHNVSIIIPVYNAENYLERCLDSVCNQTLENIEIICINDCSTDNSEKILKKYAGKYSRLKLINLAQNSGESAARNKGLELAAGEYLAFVDNDDEIDLDFCEKLYNKAVIENADIAKGETHIIGYDKKEKYEHQNDFIRKNNSILYFAYYWWTAIYRASVIKKNHIRFPEGYPLGGDVFFLNQAVLNSKKLVFDDTALYHYYRREDSGDSKVLSLEKIHSVLDLHHRILQNTNAACDYNDKGCAFINKWSLFAALQYAYRRKTREALILCINKAFDFYNTANNKELLIKNLEEQGLYISEFFLNSDRKGLIDFYLTNNTPGKFCSANLRRKLIKQKEGVLNE